MTVSPHPDSIKAGRIAGRVINEIARKVKPRIKVLKICALAERKIMEYGASGLAFPCNVSINNEAAHYTSPYGDNRVFPEKGLVKIDLGAHVNGHLSDTAVTVDLDGSYDKFIVSAKEALEAAIKIIRPNIRLGEVGSAIEKTIKRYGLRPVHQLSGHMLKPFILHAGKSVPNVGSKITAKMKLGETYAVEPFSTDGNGTIKNSRDVYIFSNVMNNRKKLDKITLRLRNIARQRFKTLPFASRWLYKLKTNFDIKAALNVLLRNGAIRGYPVLLEGKDGMVSQFEHTVFVGEKGVFVTTQVESHE
ncbi:MAG: type II methionyl aminopeptidase [Candidatus Thorarchaeota archaeon]|jgi:methionyl aminopeptidase